VVVLDSELQIIQSNNAFDKLFRTNVAEALPLSFTEIIKPYDINHKLLNSVQNVINQQKSLNDQITIDFVLGDKKIFDVSCTPLHTTEGSNVVVVMHDISIYKQVEREREDIIGFVAHELRNPLANVVLCNEVMGDAIEDNNVQVVKSMLERSKNNVMRLNKMIAELYDATRMNSGKLQLEISEFDFQEMLKEAIETIQVLQPSYNILIEGNTHLKVRADRHRLIQVVTNYLSNGIKYSNGKTDVTLTVSHDAANLTVSVTDEGLGISKEQLPFIFQKFFRAEKTRNLEGIGLGLYLCQQIIVAHKGKVWAESEEGKGSSFYFSIPL
jgi:signal transduction histidine kinase